MRKIQVKISRNIGQYKSIERWGDTYWVDGYTSQNGELIQFTKVDMLCSVCVKMILDTSINL